jgi:glycerol-3-phosphate dehydrogenase (NAD(P)+)
MSGGTTIQIDGGSSITLAVIGAGCWGTTLAALQADNFSRVNLYTPERDVCEEIARFHSNERYIDDFLIPANVMPTTSLERALDRASMALVVVPSHAVRAVARDFKGLFADRLPVVLATKGLEKSTGLLSLEVWRQETGPAGRRGGRDPMVLSGPNLAAEICRGMPAVSMVAGQDASLVRRTVAMLSHPLLSLIAHHDPLGAQAAGALKNVYAVGCGIARGLGWGDNVMATLVWRGLEETARFVEKIGGDPAVMLTPAGVGDFVATCGSPLSRNHDLGRIIACYSQANEEVRGVREGAQTAQEALRRCWALGLELQLLKTVWSVMSGLEQPRAIIEAACGALRPEADAAGLRNHTRRAEPWAPGLGLRPEMGVASE